jgi:hypothetical protein
MTKKAAAPASLKVCAEDYECLSDATTTCYDKDASGKKQCWPNTNATAAASACKAQVGFAFSSIRLLLAAVVS